VAGPVRNLIASMSNDPEVIQLRQAQQGDSQALAAIYDRYHEAMYAYVYRRVGDVETARDLTSELFHRFLEALHKGTGPDQHLQAWLYRSAHNLVVDYYRRQQHRQHLPLDEAILAGNENPAAAAEVALEASRVRHVFHYLTEEQQQVLALKFLQGLSNEEVAAVMDKPVGAVKALQHRGLKALQRHLAPAVKKVLS
jgi:RNA polymerase sigma-70 factor, ECF subfamily